MTTAMAFAISTPTSSLFHSCSSSSTGGKPSTSCSLSNSVSIPRNAVFQLMNCIPQLGFTHFSHWNALKSTGISNSQSSVKIERKGKHKGKGVFASLFGVGAPEVLVIGVVALLVFGPKGLAEVARNLGKTLRAFQPTIRELQEVSREFKTTLEREIGLDDLENPVPKSSSSNATKHMTDESGTNVEPNDSSSENVEEMADNYLKVRADRFTGALAQLQKEQEEEREREKEEGEKKEQAQNQAELQTPSEGTAQALDTPTQAPSVTAPSEKSGNSALHEAASVAPTGPPPKTETQT